VAAKQIQTYLIGAFKKWGMPKSIRIDNGAPMADPQRKRMTELTMWLTGMGVKVILNRPRRPTDNAKVERMQQTTKNWADIKNCTDAEQLQEYLDNAIEMQRMYYKVRRLGNQTRLQYYPVYRELAKWQFTRLVSNSGEFSIYCQVYYIGVKYAKQYTIIKFNAATQSWDVCDTHGMTIKNIPAKNMDASNVWNLSICQRTKKTG